MADMSSSPTVKVALIVKMRTQPGKREQVHALFRKHLASKAEANRAQEVVIWCDDEYEPDVFYLFEIYHDRGAFEANSQAPWAAEYMEEVMPLLAGSPEVGFATPRWSKGT